MDLNLKRKIEKIIEYDSQNLKNKTIENKKLNPRREFIRGRDLKRTKGK